MMCMRIAFKQSVERIPGEDMLEHVHIRPYNSCDMPHVPFCYVDAGALMCMHVPSSFQYQTPGTAGLGIEKSHSRKHELLAAMLVPNHLRSQIMRTFLAQVAR
jgi:hypothetical protein